MAAAFSVRDFVEQVAATLPPGTPIPSVSWVTYQFWPLNPFHANASRYTGQLAVKHLVQARHLNSDHVDSHYTAAIFRPDRDV